jgi:beta-glucosidase
MVLSGIKNIFVRTGLSILLTATVLSSCKSNVDLTAPDSTVQANGFLDLPYPFQQIQQGPVQPNNPVVPNNGFQWGVSTAGYQCEGYDNSSMWNHWDLAGKTKDRNPKGTDFLNRYQEDIQLAKDMGVNSFRFSIEWSRIEPRMGVIDPNGIQFYRNIIKALKDRNMTPLVTLVHFNYPQWVLDESNGTKKGLENPEFVRFFLRYVETVVKEFGPDVKYWLTFNEPNIWVPGSYLIGMTPPGKKSPLATVRAGWNLLKAHSKAYDLIHQLDPDSMVSSNVFYIMAKPFGPVTPAPGSGDQRGVQTLTDKNMDNTDWFYESIDTGKTKIDPQALVEGSGMSASQVQEKTLAEELNSTDSRGNILPAGQESTRGDSMVGWLKKFDYVSFDYYHRFHTISQVLHIDQFWNMEMYPQGLYDAIMYYHNKYHKPIMIAENGMATENLKPRADKWTRESGMVEHVKMVKSAMASGANVIGYYYWSITDNYEWGTWTPRFGLYSVNALNDPEMKRIPTPAVAVYKSIIQNNGVTAQLNAKYGKH